MTSINGNESKNLHCFNFNTTHSSQRTPNNMGTSTTTTTTTVLSPENYTPESDFFSSPYSFVAISPHTFPNNSNTPGSYGASSPQNSWQSLSPSWQSLSPALSPNFPPAGPTCTPSSYTQNGIRQASLVPHERVDNHDLGLFNLASQNHNSPVHISATLPTSTHIHSQNSTTQPPPWSQPPVPTFSSNQYQAGSSPEDMTFSPWITLDSPYPHSNSSNGMSSPPVSSVLETFFLKEGSEADDDGHQMHADKGVQQGDNYEYNTASQDQSAAYLSMGPPGISEIQTGNRRMVQNLPSGNSNRGKGKQRAEPQNTETHRITKRARISSIAGSVPNDSSRNYHQSYAKPAQIPNEGSSAQYFKGSKRQRLSSISEPYTEPSVPATVGLSTEHLAFDHFTIPYIPAASTVLPVNLTNSASELYLPLSLGTIPPAFSVTSSIPNLSVAPSLGRDPCSTIGDPYIHVDPYGDVALDASSYLQVQDSEFRNFHNGNMEDLSNLFNDLPSDNLVDVDFPRGMNGDYRSTYNPVPLQPMAQHSNHNILLPVQATQEGIILPSNDFPQTYPRTFDDVAKNADGQGDVFRCDMYTVEVPLWQSQIFESPRPSHMQAHIPNFADKQAYSHMAPGYVEPEEVEEEKTMQGERLRSAGHSKPTKSTRKTSRTVPVRTAGNTSGEDEYHLSDGQQAQVAHTGNSPPRSQPKKKSAYQQERREQVNEMRTLGACLRCQYTKISCGIGEVCKNCKDVQGKTKIWHLRGPCIRFKITDAQLFRKGNSKFQQEQAAAITRELISGNANRKKQLILVRGSTVWSGLGHAPELKISVKKFQPERGDLLHETWKDPDGKEVKLFLPAYTAIDVEETALGVQQFFKDSYSYFNLDMCSQKDPLVAAVFKEAIRFNAEQEETLGPNKTSMVKDALYLWIGSRLSAEGFSILDNPHNQNHLGIDLVKDPHSPYYQTIPVPPLLDHLLDFVGIRYMVELKATVLKKMKEKLQQRRTDNWYEIFLTLFVLLSNLEFVYRAQWTYNQRHKNTVRTPPEERKVKIETEKTAAGTTTQSTMLEAEPKLIPSQDTGNKSRIQFFTETWMAEWEHAAKMLMVHFRIALKGALPFKLDWDTYVQQQQQQQAQESSPSTASATTQTTNASRSNKKKSIESVLERAHLSAEAVKFMGYVRGELRHREGDFEKLRKKEDRRDYNHDLIWVSQLFLDEEGEA